MGTDTLKRNCVSDIAFAIKDPSACGKIDGKFLDKSEGFSSDSSLCTEFARYGDAVARNDSSACKQLSNKDRCYMKIALRLSDLSLCDDVSNQLLKDECYSSIGPKLKDVSVCDKIQDTSERNRCYGGMAHESKDASFCDKLPNLQGEKDLCLLSVSRISRDLSRCDGAKTEEKEECLYSVDRYSRDTDICWPIKNPYLKGQCFIDIARYSKDFSYCDEGPLQYRMQA